jgi:hypothetical protein
MFESRAVRRAFLASIIAAALLAVVLGGARAAADTPAPTSDSQDFKAWLFNPIQGSMFVFLCIFAAGILAGGGFVFLEYQDFKVSFELVGRILLYVLPLGAVAAVASTLVLHKYNFFLLSLYLAVPMFLAPLVYLAYDRFSGRRNTRKLQ